MTKANTKTVTVALEESQYAALLRQAADCGMRPTALARECIMVGLDSKAVPKRISDLRMEFMTGDPSFDVPDRGELIVAGMDPKELSK